MAETTGIAWTDSTWNPWIGCTKYGPGCDNCYAEALMDKRWHRVQWGKGKPRQKTSASNWQAPLHWEKHHEAFALAHGRRRRVFCASLADVFDSEAPPKWRVELFNLIEATPNLDWLLLTKRIGNAAEMMFLARGGHLPLLPNVWIGASITSQEEADRDIPKLLAVPAAKRFLSMEPLLGPVAIWPYTKPHCERHRGPLDADGKCGVCEGRGIWSLGDQLDETEKALIRPGIDWVIVGGESGAKARPIQREWIDNLRAECAAARVAFFFKQWGGASATAGGCSLDGAEAKQWPCTA